MARARHFLGAGEDPGALASGTSVRCAASGALSAVPTSNQPAVFGNFWWRSRYSGSCWLYAVWEPPKSTRIVAGGSTASATVGLVSPE